MRKEILFRGKCVSDSKYAGEWVTGGYVPLSEDITPNKEGLIMRFLGGDTTITYHVDSDTVGQFTGLLDKHGKQVFGGDIVECVSWNEYFSKDGQPMESFIRKMYVDFRKGGFKMVEPMPEPMKDNELDIIYNGDIVVIGNVYDNPDVLSSK